ncbi:hypothetical protein BC332_02721 [Capsicum chinense]|nr:hypothetical protein BC332_02721 [Capsicum chinense]
MGKLVKEREFFFGTREDWIALKVVNKEVENKFGIRRILRRKRESWECKGQVWWIGKVGLRDEKWSKGATSVQLAILLDVRCIKDGKYQQAIGVAIEYQRLDKVVEAIVKSDSVDATLAYYTSHFLKKLSFLLNFIVLSEGSINSLKTQNSRRCYCGLNALNLTSWRRNKAYFGPRSCQSSHFGEENQEVQKLSFSCQVFCSLCMF